MSHRITVRSSMGGQETLVDDKVFGHIDENGWFPAVGIKDLSFFVLTPENLRFIANIAEGHRAFVHSVRGKREVTG